jgi:hypothetical protein
MYNGLHTTWQVTSTKVTYWENITAKSKPFLDEKYVMSSDSPIQVTLFECMMVAMCTYTCLVPEHDSLPKSSVLLMVMSPVNLVGVDLLPSARAMTTKRVKSTLVLQSTYKCKQADW